VGVTFSPRLGVCSRTRMSRLPDCVTRTTRSVYPVLDRGPTVITTASWFAKSILGGFGRGGRRATSNNLRSFSESWTTLIVGLAQGAGPTSRDTSVQAPGRRVKPLLVSAIATLVPTIAATTTRAAIRLLVNVDGLAVGL